MINKCLDISQIIEQTTTQNLIDIQFKYTKEQIKWYFIIYFLGFFIPYLYNSLALIDIDILEESQTHFIFRWALYSLQLTTQLYFLILEIPEIYYNSLAAYFQEIYNIFDITIPISFILHLILRIYFVKVDGQGWLQLLDNLIEITIIIGSTFKILQYIMFKEEFVYFVQMFFGVIVDLVPFLLVFILFIISFTFFQIILGTQADGSDYPGLHPFMIHLFSTFRISIGDLQIYDYSIWADNPKAENPEFSSIVRNIVVIIVWFFWIFDIYLILIVMLNLLISQVSQIYDKVMSQGKINFYKMKAQNNLKAYQSQYFFGIKNEYEALIMQTPIQDPENLDGDEFMTTTEKIKKSTQGTVDKMESKIQSKIVESDNNINVKMEVLENKINVNMVNLESNIQSKIEESDNNINVKMGVFEKNVNDKMEVLESNIQSKIEESVNNTNVKMGVLESNIYSKIEESDNNINVKMGVLENQIQSKIGESDNNINVKMQVLEKIQSKIGQSDNNINDKMDVLENKIYSKIGESDNNINVKMQVLEIIQSKIGESDNNINVKMEVLENNINIKIDLKIENLEKSINKKMDQISQNQQKQVEDLFSNLKKMFAIKKQDVPESKSSIDDDGY